MLDTDAVVDVLRGRHGVRERLAQHSPDDVAVTSMTVAELTFGAHNAQHAARVLAELERFLAEVRVLPFGAKAARIHGELRHALRRQPVGPADLVIAATTLTAGATLVTANVKEFARVPGLIVENWRA